MNNNPIVQAAAKFKNAWHPNSILNGLPVDLARHSGSHNLYDTWVKARLLKLENLGVHNNSEKAYNALADLANDLKIIIDANPNIKINDLPLP